MTTPNDAFSLLVAKAKAMNLTIMVTGHADGVVDAYVERGGNDVAGFRFVAYEGFATIELSGPKEPGTDRREVLLETSLFYEQPEAASVNADAFVETIDILAREMSVVEAMAGPSPS